MGLCLQSISRGNLWDRTIIRSYVLTAPCHADSYVGSPEVGIGAGWRSSSSNHGVIDPQQGKQSRITGSDPLWPRFLKPLISSFPSYATSLHLPLTSSHCNPKLSPPLPPWTAHLHTLCSCRRLRLFFVSAKCEKLLPAPCCSHFSGF